MVTGMRVIKQSRVDKYWPSADIKTYASLGEDPCIFGAAYCSHPKRMHGKRISDGLEPDWYYVMPDESFPPERPWWMWWSK